MLCSLPESTKELADGLTIARTTKLTTDARVHAEDEPIAAPTDTPHAVETEFHGGEGVDPADAVDELIDAAELSSPLFGALSVQQWTDLLSRRAELQAAQRPGRKSQEVKQMKAFDDVFHAELHSLSPSNDAKLQEVQRSYGTGHEAALDMQNAIMKQMKRVAATQGETFTDDNIGPGITDAVLHNLQQHQPACEWIELADALRGPAHVAKMLIRRCQDARSTPARPYKLNAEQLECVALFVDRLEKAFSEHGDMSQPWIHPARVIMTIIMDGGGGCGKTTLSTEILLPLLESFFHPEGVLRRAPSNKPARHHALWPRTHT